MPDAHRWRIVAPSRRHHDSAHRRDPGLPGERMSTFLGTPRRRPGDPLLPERPFSVAAGEALGDSQLRRNLGHATRTIRGKRAEVVAEVPDWEQLRAAGSAIKAATLAELDRHLERLEREVTARG